EPEDHPDHQGPDRHGAARAARFARRDPARPTPAAATERDEEDAETEHDPEGEDHPDEHRGGTLPPGAAIVAGARRVVGRPHRRRPWVKDMTGGATARKSPPAPAAATSSCSSRPARAGRTLRSWMTSSGVGSCAWSGTRPDAAPGSSATEAAVRSGGSSARSVS